MKWVGRLVLISHLMANHHGQSKNYPKNSNKNSVVFVVSSCLSLVSRKKKRLVEIFIKGFLMEAGNG